MFLLAAAVMFVRFDSVANQDHCMVCMLKSLVGCFLSVPMIAMMKSPATGACCRIRI
jgi:hypothetical protein